MSAAERAAAGYDEAARLAGLARAELLQRLQFFALEPRWIVDLGAGTCRGAQALAERFPAAHVLALDVSLAMLAAAPRRRWLRRSFERVCADAYALPLTEHCVDLIYSNLMLQWRERPEMLFTELARALRPGGLLLFCCLGSDTLRELRSSWASADSAPHLHEFPDMPQLGEALVQAGFVEPVMDVERHTKHYGDAFALLHELKRCGAHPAIPARSGGLGGRSRLQAMSERYERQREPAGLPATFELIFGTAFARERSGRTRSPAHASAEVAVPIGSIRPRRRLEPRRSQAAAPAPCRSLAARLSASLS